MCSEPVTLDDRLVKQVQKNIATHTNIASPFANVSKRQPVLEQQYSAFLPNGDTNQCLLTYLITCGSGPVVLPNIVELEMKRWKFNIKKQYRTGKHKT